MNIRSAEQFIKLRESDRPEDYRQATWGQATDSVWFEIIDRYPNMRRWVAQNKTLSAPVLMRLAGDSDVRVRYGVATTPGLGEGVLDVLMNDVDASIRRVIVTQDNLSPDQLKRLAADSDADVAGDAAEQLEWLQRA